MKDFALPGELMQATPSPALGSAAGEPAELMSTVAAPSLPAARTSVPRLYVVPLVVFLVSRGLLATLAYAGPHVLGSLRGNHSSLPMHDPLSVLGSWSSPWFRFDAGWYVGVAQHGYHWGSLGRANTNFFPLYPLLIRVFQPVTLGSPWIASLVVANLSFLGALLLLWRWSLNHFSQDVSLRVVLLTTAFPFAFFFATPYAEALFLGLATATFLFAEQDRWVLASCAAGLAALTRPVGLAVVIALVILALQRRSPTRLLLACSAFLPFLGFVAYLTIAFGHPLGFLTYHSAGWVAPHGGLTTTIGSQFHTHLSPLDRLDAALVVAFIGSAFLVWRRLGPAYAAYVLLGVGLPLAHGLVSMERYVIVLFPVLAAWATWRAKSVQALLFSGSLMLLICATMMFAAGYSLF